MSGLPAGWTVEEVMDKLLTARAAERWPDWQIWPQLFQKRDQPDEMRFVVALTNQKGSAVFAVSFSRSRFESLPQFGEEAGRLVREMEPAGRVEAQAAAAAWHANCQLSKRPSCRWCQQEGEP